MSPLLVRSRTSVSLTSPSDSSWAMWRSRSAGDSQRPSSSVVCPISSSRANPRILQNSWLTSMTCPSFTRLIAIPAGTAMNTLANFSSETRRASSACLRPLTSVTNERVAGPSVSRTGATAT